MGWLLRENIQEELPKDVEKFNLRILRSLFKGNISRDWLRFEFVCENTQKALLHRLQ